MEEFQLPLKTEVDSAVYQSAKNEGCIKSAEKVIKESLSSNRNIIDFISKRCQSNPNDILFIPLMGYYNRLPMVLSRTLQFAFNRSLPPFESYFSGRFGSEGNSILKNGEPTFMGAENIFLVVDLKSSKESFIEILKRDFGIHVKGIIYSP